ncbi:MAG TPA: ABC transporter ATP-binding protein [Candidatus Kryptonia bacterium]
MIELSNVTKTFSGTVALDSISFKVERGSACGYIGPNGAGKSTTARIVVGLEKQDSGKVTVVRDGTAEDPIYRRSKIGYVPESPRLYESLTPAETIEVASLLRKFDRKRSRKQLEVLSEIFQFAEYLHRALLSLSKGTRQKVALTLALVFDPEVLILDEPTDGLDVQAISSLKQVMKSFTSRGGTILYCSHLLDLVENVCDKVYFINKGRITDEFMKDEFTKSRGFLEQTFMNNIGSHNEQRLIDDFFGNAH